MKKITLEQWRNVHPDYKRCVDGIPYMAMNGKGVTFLPVEIDRSKPPVITPDKFIGAWTSGLMAESSAVREAIETAFSEAVKDHVDHFYSVEVSGRKFFVASNGEMGYTAMLPDEY